jgi:asparaginyl-tRNA synthetase
MVKQCHRFSDIGLLLQKERTKAVVRIQHEILRTARAYFEQREFIEIIPPIFEPFTDSGTGRAALFEIDYYGVTYHLMSALTVHKPILATHFGRIFALCPCSRKEPAESQSTGRHLAQFYQLEVEVADFTYQEVMDILEELITTIIETVVVTCKEELQVLKRDLKVPRTPFRRITFKEAVNQVRYNGLGSCTDELSAEAERVLSCRFSDPFFVTHFPKTSSKARGFLYREEEDVLLDFDLILPDGFGEVSSGSEREWRYEKITEKIQQEENPHIFTRYLTMIKGGLRPTSGFGIGIERLTTYICGLTTIWDACLFPKVPGNP